MVHPNDREMVEQFVAQVLAGEELPPIEHRIVRKDRAVRWVRDTIVSHCDDNGRLVRYDGVVEDISDRRRAEQALWDKEVQLLAAQKIQEGLLPHAAPELPGFDIAGALVAAEFAAGDYFDYLPMPDGSLGVVIADVAGHGFAPALITASTQVLLRSLAETHTDVGEILTRANFTLLRETEEQLFVTILYVRLDPQTGSLVYASAGHPAGYVLDEAGEVKARLESTGLPLAIIPDAKSAISGPIILEPGDTVLLVTDGISEARSPTGEFFGKDRTLEVFCANRHKNACEIVESLFNAIREFSQRSAPEDDTTAVVIKVTR
jgi:sigma-B regulation protein RsbU (phosphoserine phosphatase)